MSPPPPCFKEGFLLNSCDWFSGSQVLRVSGFRTLRFSGFHGSRFQSFSLEQQACRVFPDINSNRWNKRDDLVFSCIVNMRDEAGLTMWGALLGEGLVAGWFSPVLWASLSAAICCSAAWVCSWRRWAWPACSPRALSNTLTALSFSFISSICTHTGGTGGTDRWDRWVGDRLVRRQTAWGQMGSKQIV